MRTWVIHPDWSEIVKAESFHTKDEVLQTMLLQKYKEIFPEKTHRVSSDDQPWITHKLRSIDRRRKGEYRKHRNSEKWPVLNKEFKTNVKSAKFKFYQKIMDDLTNKNTSKWYSS